MSPHERSQRYVNINKAEDSGYDADYCVIPDTVLEDETAFEIFSQQVISARESYNKLIERGIPKEDARYLLPGASKTSLIATFNGRSLIHFFKLRCCNRAQYEHRQVATAMLNEVRRVCPEIFNLVGPSCYMEGHCPEGKMSCGKFLTVQQKFTPEK
jgi:thymidylate synthase (FAD)